MQQFWEGLRLQVRGGSVTVHPTEKAQCSSLIPLFQEESTSLGTEFAFSARALVDLLVFGRTCSAGYCG